ncbi:hypothetical protein V9T40_002349 [Parthenolecanium corni]|uniref:Carboxylesterase type B domain-containing protein n=1 Tax=Parthenolecanium corni TaxID=536013 RepID=A0AAN9TWY6_9HEMI
MSVKVGNGTIIGNENVCKLTGQVFHSYLGIPYAKPPIGDLRFQPPQKADKIEDEFDATMEGDDCIQMSRIRPGTTGSEDCLYVNVYVPKNPEESNDKSLKPVIVYVHGGIFTYMSGSSTNFSPDYLVSRGVIVVTMNYRLHVFGFLDLALPECPGNVGLLDQIMAFKWVKDNISYFGGDPDNVTAFGTSSGAVSIHLFAMSPLTRDLKLFNKIISASCNIFSCPIRKENAQDTAFELGHRLGYRGRNREALLKFLRSIPAEELTEKMNDYYLAMKTEMKGDVFCFPFLPTVQKLKEGAVIPEDPNQMIKYRTKMPILTGLLNRDGLMGFYLEPFLMTFVIENLFSVLQRNLKIADDDLPRVMDLIQSHYFQYRDLDYNAFPEAVNLFTDMFWLRRFYDQYQSELASEDCSVYVFEFKYDGGLNCYKKYYPLLTRWIEGAAHDDILGYCLPFKYDLASRFSNKRDLQVIKYVCTYLCNFAATGNPNNDTLKTQWRNSTAKDPCYLQISDMLKMTNGKINEKSAKVWERINKMVEEREIILKSTADTPVDD